MGMKAYSGPDEWLADAEAGQQAIISDLRAAISRAADFDQSIKYGNLFFERNGPAILIRHEPDRLIVGLFRGKRMLEIEPALEPSGKYELASVVLRDGETIAGAVMERLAREAARLNDELGDPRKDKR